eukprot:m.259045 g.259045  ORF g.259045 m.259045 type:complete len:73 (+) comp250066_c0_seq1:3-221(+)
MYGCMYVFGCVSVCMYVSVCVSVLCVFANRASLLDFWCFSFFAFLWLSSLTIDRHTSFLFSSRLQSHVHTTA